METKAKGKKFWKEALQEWHQEVTTAVDLNPLPPMQDHLAWKQLFAELSA